jgi:putative glutamine amidotransferase
MAVAFGGTLRTLPAKSAAIHVEDTSIPRDAQYLPVHTTTVDPGGLLERICGSDELYVNSLHRQAVETLGPVLRREAVAPDGVVEAASLPGAHPFMLGVQWHPEWHAESDPTSRVLLKAFGTAARERSSVLARVGEG